MQRIEACGDLVGQLAHCRPEAVGVSEKAEGRLVAPFDQVSSDGRAYWLVALHARTEGRRGGFPSLSVIA